MLTFNREQLTVILAVYGFTAATLPVWLLLTPRDYLSTYMKIGTILLLTLGVVIVRPMLQMPAVTEFVHGNGPIIPGKVWPFMFITIACGALSGFHALIASGTTPKMISSERDIIPIGYGGMLIESFISVIALIAAAHLYPADYYAINTLPEVFRTLDPALQQIKELPWLSEMIGEDVSGRPGGAVSLAVGMTSIFSRIPFFSHLASYWYHFAIMFEALFILTTIDAGTRVGRYLLQEAGGKIYKPLGNLRWWPGVILTGGAISFAWGYLVYGGTVSTIWPLVRNGQSVTGHTGTGDRHNLSYPQGKTALYVGYRCSYGLPCSYHHHGRNTECDHQLLPKGELSTVGHFGDHYTHDRCGSD